MQPSAADSAHARFLVDSLYREIQGGADFREIAKAFSDDDATRATGGEMEMMSVANLRPEFVEPLGHVEPGEITEPVVSSRGFHILKLIERIPGHDLSIDQDYDLVKSMTRQEKTAEMVEKWVDELKEKIYVDIRDVEMFK